ncbi:13647_t:CDS:2 [Dentiscutata heterogama]|uniref:13647_t:CDS:1 n=1 Tax=Dentiscutata heterogama TaxID=1316150 RepID=A0ACA9N6U7_9GLOM|nr:13647_t:CDS:2 [Dentiscutata heterogama]
MGLGYLSSQIPLQISSQTPLQVPSHGSLQISPQILSQIPSHISSQLPTNFLLQISNNFSAQLLNNFFSHLSNIPLQASANISLQISPNLPLQILPNISFYTISSQLLSNISPQSYFMLFSIFPNLQPLINNSISHKLSTTSLKPVPKLEEFLTKIDEAKNVNGKILAYLRKFQDYAIQVNRIYKLTDQQLELVGITKIG